MTDANGNILSPPTIYTTCNLTGTMQRFLLQNVTLLNNANIAHIWPVIAFTTPANTAVDFTLRLGGIQVERGAICTALSLPLAGSPGPSASLPSPNALALPTPVGINGAGGKVNYVRNALGLGGAPGVLGQSGVAPIEYSINAVPGCTVEFQGAYVTPEGIPVTRWRFLGTTTTTNPFGINWFRAAPIQNQPKFSGGVVVVSNYYRLYAGSTSGIANFQHWGESFDAANVAQPYPGNGWNPQPNTDLNRTVGTLTFNVAGTPPYRIQSGGVVIYTTGIGAVIDCTLEIGGWQLEEQSLSSLFQPADGTNGPVSRALEALPNAFASAQASIAGTGGLSVDCQLGTFSNVNGVGNVRASATVIARANSIILGGEGNSIRPPVPGPQSPNTITVTTAIAPPFNDNQLVFLHTVNATASHGGSANTATGAPVIPHQLRVWFWVPVAYAGTLIEQRAEGAWGTGVNGVANLNLDNQWQLVTAPALGPTSPLPVVVRTTDTVTPDYFYTSMWAAVPITVVAQPNQYLSAACTIAGVGGVRAVGNENALELATLPGVGSFRAAATNYAATSATLAGVGGVLASAIESDVASALIGGVGSFTANAQPMRAASASFAGAGSVAASATVNAIASSRIAGLASVSTLPIARLLLASAQFNGNGGGETNFIRNPRLEGASNGINGVFPTFWQCTGDTGMSYDIVGTGTEDGMTFVDLRVHGNIVATNCYILPEGLTTASPVANPAVPNTLSVYCRILSGSMTNINYLQLQAQYRNLALTNLGNSTLTFTPSATGTIGQFRYQVSGTPTAGAQLSIPVLYFIWTASSTGLPVDITMRIAGWQLEWGSPATQLIYPPSGTLQAWTRGIDAGPAWLMAGIAGINGTGSVSAYAMRIVYANASINGVAALFNTPSAWGTQAQANVAGVGGVTASAVPARAASAAFGGVGSLTANAVVLAQSTASAAGQGSVSVVASINLAASAIVNGLGAFSAFGGIAIPNGATI